MGLGRRRQGGYMYVLCMCGVQLHVLTYSVYLSTAHSCLLSVTSANTLKMKGCLTVSML